MRSHIPSVFLALPLLLAVGCAGGEQAQEGEETGEMEAAAESSMEMAPALTLSSMNESGVTGTADISHTEESMSVTLELSGLEAGATYAAHIHRGSCENQGPVAAPLGSVTAAADGTGTIEASIPMSDLGAMEEGAMEEGAMEEAGEEAHAGFYVQAHSPDGTPAACANIQGPAGEMSEM